MKKLKFLKDQTQVWSKKCQKLWQQIHSSVRFRTPSFLFPWSTSRCWCTDLQRKHSRAPPSFLSRPGSSTFLQKPGYLGVAFSARFHPRYWLGFVFLWLCHDVINFEDRICTKTTKYISNYTLCRTCTIHNRWIRRKKQVRPPSHPIKIAPTSVSTDQAPRHLCLP